MDTADPDTGWNYQKVIELSPKYRALERGLRE